MELTPRDSAAMVRSPAAAFASLLVYPVVIVAIATTSFAREDITAN